MTTKISRDGTGEPSATDPATAGENETAPGADLRERRIEQVVSWKLAGKGPADDPARLVYQLVNTMPEDELMEAMRRIASRSRPQ